MQHSGVVTEVRHEWVWEGEVSMLPNRLRTSGGQSSLVSQQPWLFVEVTVPQSEAAAMQALDRLYGRTVAESTRCRARAAETGDTVRQGLANWLIQWLRTEGREIRDEIARKIRPASPSDQIEMRAAIQATEELLDLTEQHVPKPSDDWDCVWEWAKEILPSLRRSFRHFPGSDLDEPADVTDADATQLSLAPVELFLDTRPPADTVQTWVVLRRAEQTYDRQLLAVA